VLEVPVAVRVVAGRLVRNVADVVQLAHDVVVERGRERAADRGVGRIGLRIFAGGVHVDAFEAAVVAAERAAFVDAAVPCGSAAG
jgi:hypothetical protein